MLPYPIQTQLDRLRRRERLLRGLWGTLLVLAICAGALAVACFTDWIVDRFVDTPMWLRLTLSCTQAALLIGVGYFFVYRPVMERLTPSMLARFVEERKPLFQHRLVTTVELMQLGASMDGMSKKMLDTVVKEVTLLSSRVDFADTIDPKRFWRCLWVGLGLLAFVLLPLVLFPATATALVSRQLLAERDIPRSVHLEPVSPRIWPGGDPVALRFAVSGDGWTKESMGKLELTTEDGIVEEHPLVWQEEADGKAYFVAKIPSSSAGFRYRAWLEDGRTRQTRDVVFRPRPSITRQSASEILPSDCGVRPDGTRYEEHYAKGDIVAFRDSTARVMFEANKPVRKALLQMMTSQDTDSAERVSREIEFELAKNRKAGEVLVDLKPSEHAYRIVLVDAYGLKNKYPTRRNIQYRPDDPPQVALLPERFPAEGASAFLEDTEVDGIPAIPGQRIRIAYRAQTTRALGRAMLRYRVLPEGMEPTPEFPEWKRFPLGESKGGAAGLGKFNLELGVFKGTPEDAEIEFHAVESPSPMLMRGRLRGGGRFDFETKPIQGLRNGMKIEYYVEVYDRKKDSPPGASEIRVKDVVDPSGMANWLVQKRNEAEELKELEQSQRELYDPTKKVEPE